MRNTQPRQNKQKLGFKNKKPNGKEEFCLVFFNLKKTFKYIKMD